MISPYTRSQRQAIWFIATLNTPNPNQNVRFWVKQLPEEQIILALEKLYQKKFTRFAGHGIQSMRPIFKIKMLTFQSKANLDDMICLVKSLII